jgi:hypothetical protein
MIHSLVDSNNRAAENNPETSGPAENLREEAAEMVDEEEDSSEPA